MGHRSSKNRDPATVQHPQHFISLRFNQREKQARSYAQLKSFVCTQLIVTLPEERAGHRVAPVAVFTDVNNKQRRLHTRDLKRLYRLALADAKEEARILPAPGPASVFLEIAKNPYEEMRATASSHKLWSAREAITP